MLIPVGDSHVKIIVSVNVVLELVPVRGEKNSIHAHNKVSWYLLAGSFQNFRPALWCGPFYMGVVPPRSHRPQLHAVTIDVFSWALFFPL